MTEYNYGSLKLRAIGIGGIESCYILPSYDIAFDFGRCPDPLVDTSQVFLTHGHLDHSSGLPYYFSQRSLKRLPPGTVYAPAAIVEPLSEILRIWHKIEDFTYEIQLKPLNPGDRVDIGKDLQVVALKANHRIPAHGYALVRKTTKLKPQYLHLSGDKIKKLKESKEDIFEIKEKSLFCFSGDTTIEFVLENELAREAEVLLLECTYIDEKRPVQRARDWGHIHLDEIAAHATCFKNERLLLTHFSKRYKSSYIQKIVQRKLPEDLMRRTELLTPPFH